MKKNALIFAQTIALLTFGTAGQAWNPTTDTADIVLHHAGSSASSSTFFNNVRSLCVADADVFVDAGNVNNASNGLDVANEFSGNYWVVACEVNNTTVANLAAGNKKLLYYKRDAGGSAVGVLSVAAQSNVAFMGIDSTNCPTVNDGATNFHVCSGYSTAGGNTSLHVAAPPDLGSSDVEPKILAAPNNTPTPNSIDFDNDGSGDPNPIADVSTLTPEGAGFLGFGVAVNTRMYTGLQFDQFETTSVCHPDNGGYGSIEAIGDAANSEACMPTMTKSSVTAVFVGGRAVDEIPEIADTGTMPVDGADGNATDDVTAATVKPLENLTDDKVQICRRTRGSGAQAQHSVQFFNYPCESDQDGSIDVSLPADPLPPFLDPAQSVTNNAGAADLSECLLGFNDGSAGKVRWAVGMQPLTRTDSHAKQYRFVKIDGVAPTLENTHGGRYNQWFRQSIQRAPGGLAGDKDLVVNQIVANQSDPATLAGLNVTHGFGVGGWVAEPSSTFPPSATLDAALPVGRYEKRSFGGNPNSCATPRAYNANGVKIELK